jgi:hypothetical protein
VQCSAAFCSDTGDTPGLVLLVETRRNWLRRAEDRHAVCQAIGHALFSAFQLQADCIELLRPLAIPRTSSGKLRRAHARELFLAGQLCAPVTTPPAMAAGVDPMRAALPPRP